MDQFNKKKKRKKDKNGDRALEVSATTEYICYMTVSSMVFKIMSYPTFSILLGEKRKEGPEGLFVSTIDVYVCFSL